MNINGEPSLLAGFVCTPLVRFPVNSLKSSEKTRGTTVAELEQVEMRERGVLQRRLERLRSVRPREPLTGRTALLIDDGIATGATARAACQVVRAAGARHVVLAAVFDNLGKGASGAAVQNLELMLAHA